MEQKKSVDNPFEKNKYEIKYILINSALIGAISFLSAISISLLNHPKPVDLIYSAAAGLITGLSIAIIKFQAYWSKEQKEYCESNAKKLLNII